MATPYPRFHLYRDGAMVRHTKKKKGFLYTLNGITHGRIHFKVYSSPGFYNESIKYNFPEDKKEAIKIARIFSSKQELES